MAIGCAAVLCGWATPEFARAEDLELEGVQAAASELPRLHVLLRRPQGATPPDQTLPLDSDEGATFFFDAYADTGTSGNLLSREWLDNLGVQLQLDNNGDPVEFFDVAVAGVAGFYISEPLYSAVAPYPGPDVEVDSTDLATINQIWDQTNHAQTWRWQVATEYADGFLTQPRNVLGMPSMIGRALVTDVREFFHPDFLFRDPSDPEWRPAQLHTDLWSPGATFVDGDPGTTSGVPDTDYTIRLSMSSLDGFTAISDPTAEFPKLVHNPFIGADPADPTPDPNAPPGITIKRDRLNGNSTVSHFSSTGNWLLDTAAQVSFMSEEQAENLDVGYEIDPNTGEWKTDPLGVPNLIDLTTGESMDGQFSVLIGGASNEFFFIAGFTLDELIIPAEEGDLIYRDVPIVVLSIVLDDGQGNVITLDGDIGMNLFIPSFDPNTLEGVGGAFDWMVFDEANRELRLSVGTIIPEPATAATAGLFAAGALLGRRRRRRVAA